MCTGLLLIELFNHFNLGIGEVPVVDIVTRSIYNITKQEDFKCSELIGRTVHRQCAALEELDNVKNVVTRQGQESITVCLIEGIPVADLVLNTAVKLSGLKLRFVIELTALVTARKLHLSICHILK